MEAQPLRKLVVLSLPIFTFLGWSAVQLLTQMLDPTLVNREVSALLFMVCMVGFAPLLSLVRRDR